MYRPAFTVASSIKAAATSSKKQLAGRVLAARQYVAKDINFGVGARAAMLQGVNEVADVVKLTMGPRGRNVIIEKSRGEPKVTKDGATVAKAIEFQDKAKNVGADLIKQVAKAAKKSVGDGTTCTTVLAQAILTEGCKAVAAGVNVMDLRYGINLAMESVVSYLKSKAVMICTPEEIAQVASVSANCDPEIGDLIVRAFEKVGKDGVITVSNGNTLFNELEVVEGMKLARGYISPYFITDQRTQKCELENPLILIYDKKIRGLDSLVGILELALEKQKPLLIVAEDVESDALTMLILNKHEIGLKVCAVKAPGFGDNRKANLEDLAILAGGEVISEDRGLTLEKAKLEMLGTAKKVTVSLDDTIILQGGGDRMLIEERCDQLRKAIEESTALFDKEEARERLSKLSGGVAVLKIGGASDAEVGERKGRAKDALQATLAAMEEGVLPGGGVALLYAARELDKLQTSNIDQKTGVQIIQKALKAPTSTIAANAGIDGAIVVSKLLEGEDENFGYDAAKGEYVDMVKAGIIDPVKVVRSAVVDAASVSTLLTTTEAVIIERAGEIKPPSRMPELDDTGYD